MWIYYQSALVVLLSIYVQISHSLDYDCDHELWDEVTEGRGVKKLSFSCISGQIIWHGPYGGLFVNINGPAKEHQLCIQAQGLHTSVLISAVEESSTLKRLLTVTESPENKQHKHTTCFPAHGSSLLFIETDIGAYLSSKVIIDYDIEPNPRYGDEACRPCTDEELLYNYCTSDFVAIGHMKDLVPGPSVNTISVSLDMVKQQTTQYFTKRSANDKTYQGRITSPGQCDMSYGRGKFVFMGKIKFGKAELRCAPTYDDFSELQRTSKLKGAHLCT